MGRSAEAHADALACQPVLPKARTTFEDLGLHTHIVTALRTAFPNVEYPTETQARFIPAILGGKDVLLKDETGSGKSFGLVVALLNKPRLKSTETLGGKTREKRHVTSLVIVPHRDLAYQLFHWIERISLAASVHPPPLMSSIAQVMVRDGATHLTAGLHSLREMAPHILIGTPQALLDMWKQDSNALQLSYISSVVVDEVDYLIETVPKKDANRSFHKSYIKASKKLRAHPGATRELLDIIYSKRKEMNDWRRDEPGATQQRRRSGQVDEFRHSSPSPQLILSSATLRSHLNNYLFDESGWLNKDRLLKVKGIKTASPEKNKVEEQYPHDGLGGTNISHSVLLVSHDGIENIAGAVAHRTPDSADHQPISPETLFTPSMTSEPADVDPRTVEKYANTPSPFNPDALEAIATAFALDVPSIALLVLPSSAPVQRAVYELRMMGVNACGLDLLVEDRGRSHLLHGGEATRENPTLLVSTLATTRGLDLPELTHVFILGIPEGPKVNGRAVDAYLHIAGRVGRFGRGGKVITVVEKEKDVAGVGDEGERWGTVTEGSKMARILNTIQATPVQFEHFD